MGTVMKTVIQVEIYCLKCKKRVMKDVAGFTGVNQIEVNEEKNTVTVIGDVDIFEVTKKLRKSRKTATILTAEKAEAEKEKGKEEKKEATSIPCSCHRCETIQLSYLAPSWPEQYCAIL